MRKRWPLIVLASFLAPALVGSQGGPPGDEPAAGPLAPAAAEGQVLAKLHAVNVFEIGLARLAQEKGAAPEIRRFGVLVERDRRHSEWRLGRVARHEGLPLGPPALLPEEEDDLAALQAAPGPEFDLLYARAAAHRLEDAARVLESLRAGLDERDVSDFIARQIRVLYQHHQIALRLSSAEGG